MFHAKKDGEISYGPSGGTSASAPSWAGSIALIDQGRAANGKKPLGFASPALYVHGYDLATGLGTPTCALLKKLSAD